MKLLSELLSVIVACVEVGVMSMYRARFVPALVTVVTSSTGARNLNNNANNNTRLNGWAGV